MTNPGRILFSLLALPILSSTAVEICQGKNEQPLEFRFFTDNNSYKDNGWILECEYDESTKEMLWEVPVGSLKQEDRTQVIREAACIPDSATCTLRLFDASGDGLQSNRPNNNDAGEIIDEDGSESFTGWFALLHGATTIGTYQTVADPNFSELTYCVGPKCDQDPLEKLSNDESCQKIVYLTMQLDNNPADTSYKLVCNDNDVIWDGKNFNKAGAFIEEETCLPRDACCEFVLSDASTNGLTQDLPTGLQSAGFVYLELNYDPILEYDGASGEVFDQLMVDFGCDGGNSNDANAIETEDVELASSVPNDEEEFAPADGEVVNENEYSSTESPTTHHVTKLNSLNFAPLTDDGIYQEDDDGGIYGPWNGYYDDTDDVQRLDDDSNFADDEFDHEDDDGEELTWEGFDENFQWSFQEESEATKEPEESTWKGFDENFQWNLNEYSGVTYAPTFGETEEDTSYETKAPVKDLFVTVDDDLKWTEEEMKELEDLVVEADKHPEEFTHVVKFSGEDNNGKKQLQQQQQQGLSDGGKIAIGVIIGCLLSGILFALALYCFFRDTWNAIFSGNHEKNNDDDLEKPDTNVEDFSNASTQSDV